jgi:hypothetical protein
MKVSEDQVPPFIYCRLIRFKPRSYQLVQPAYFIIIQLLLSMYELRVQYQLCLKSLEIVQAS